MKESMKSIEEINLLELSSNLATTLDQQLGGHFAVSLKKLERTEQRDKVGPMFGFELVFNVTDRSHFDRLKGGVPYTTREAVSLVLENQNRRSES